MANKILEQIKDILEVKELKYYCDEEERIGAGFTDFAFMFHATEDCLDFRLQMKLEVPKEYCLEVLQYLNRVNCITKEGHWEMDAEVELTGTIAFRMCEDLSVEYGVEDYRIVSMIEKGIAAVSLFGEGMKKIASGESTATVAYLETMVEQLMD